MLILDILVQRKRFTLNAKFEFTELANGLFGPSGSGKTTLLAVVAGLITPQQGWVKMNGDVLFDSHRKINIPAHRRRIGVVFQDSQLFPHLSIKSNLLYGFNRIPERERRFKVATIVELLHLGHLLESRPRYLSGGEKQRVALGRSLLASPRLLLLDEPLASLDQGLKEQILPFLKRVKDELQIPMIYVSHALHEILYLTDNLAVISHGQIRGVGNFHEVIKNSAAGQLMQRLGWENVMAVTIVAHDSWAGCTMVSFNKISLFLPLNTKHRIDDVCYIAVRPADVTLANQPVNGISIQNQLQGRIIAIIINPSNVIVEVDIGVRLFAEITLRALNELGLKENHTVYCLIKAQSFSYFLDYARSS